ncbi:MAG: glycosyltransferase [Phycisphaerales bacterium]|nr:glycosyltransferase [Phycisphaerales bacterium]
MEIAWRSLEVVLLVAASATTVYYLMALQRIVRGQFAQPTLRAARALAAKRTQWPRLVVVVPAHNEEGVIEHCARTLLESDYPDLCIVFALDRCTDGTASVIDRVAQAHEAGAVRLEVCMIAHCPDDWAGKTHALHRGYRDAKLVEGAELVLFCDADTNFEPDALRAAVALMMDRKIDLLSLLPTLTQGTWFERMVQPAAGLELIRQFPLDRVNAPGTRRHFANGQFMLWRREAFDAIGGHERVKSELLEDIALARALHKPIRPARTPSPYRAGCFMADGLMYCRMYANWGQFKRGWKRIYAEAARRYPGQLRRHARRLRVVGTFAPMLALSAVCLGGVRGGSGLGLGLVVVGAVGLLVFGLAIGLVLRAQRARIGWVLAYPIGAWCVSRLMFEAARDLEQDRPTEWGGRSYSRARAEHNERAAQ